MRKKLIPYVLLIPQLMISLIFLAGIVTGITQSFGVIPAFQLTKPTLKYYKEILTSPDMLQSVMISLYIALVSAVVAVVIGVILCAAFVYTNKIKGITMRIVQLPIIVPHVVVALFVINIFSQNGILARIAYALGLIQEQQQFIQILYAPNGIGIIIAYLWKEIPFVIYFVITIMANINSSFGETAVNLGASPISAFLRITLPLCKDSIISCFLIIFTFALGAYELPFILGATSPKALPILAYIQYTHPDLRHRPYSMALNGIISVISIVCAILYFALIKSNMKKMRKRAGVE